MMKTRRRGKAECRGRVRVLSSSTKERSSETDLVYNKLRD